MKRFLLSLLLAATLTGCGVFGSEDSSPDWTGDWRLTEDFSGEVPTQEVYFSYSEDRLTTFADDPGAGCDIFTREIVKVDGNEIELEIGASGLETQRLTVSGEDLSIRIVRSNNSTLQGETLRAASVDTSPRELLGCKPSTTAKGKGERPPLRQQ
jgi:hypothetical protein